MNDLFERRVRAAAVAGWWVFLIATAFLFLQWFVYLYMMSARPAWLISLWGPEITWDFVQNVSFWILAEFKLCLWLFAVGLLWLTLWARQLRKHRGAT